MAPGTRGDARGKGGVLLAPLILLTFQAALFAPYLLSGDHYFPLSPWSSPPWGPSADHPIEGGQDHEGTDKLSFNYPNVVRWNREIVRDPSALLWNPDNWCGISYLATQNTHVLYPGNLVFLALGPADGMLGTALLHGWLASWFAWLALRRVVKPSAALIGAVVYGGSGWFLVHHDMVQFGQASAWVPLFFLGADLAARRGGPGGPALLAFALLLSFLGGMPQMTILGLFAAGIACLFHLVGVARADGTRPALAGAGRAFSGVALGCVLAAPQLLPTLEIRGGSARSVMPLEEMHDLAGSPVDLVELVMPGVLGDTAPLSQMAADAEDRDAARAFVADISKRGFVVSESAGVREIGHGFPERVLYPGMAALLLAVGALMVRPDARTALAWILLLLGGTTMMGTPVLDLLYRIPAFQFASPRRFVFIVVIACSMLAAIGAERFLVSGSTGTRSARRPLMVGGALGLGLLAFLAVVIGWPDTVVDRIAPDGMDDPQASWVALWFRNHAVLSFSTVVVACVALWTGTTFRVRWVSVALVLAAMAVDLTWFHTGTNPGQDGTDEPFPRTDVIRWLQDRHGDLANGPAADGSGLFRIIRYRNPATDFPQAAGDMPPLPPNLNILYGIQDVQGFEAITDRHVEELMELVESGVSREHHLLRELREPTSLASPILDLMGVRYVLSPAQSLPATSFVPLPEEWMLKERVALHQRPNALPRFIQPARVDVVADEDAVRARMGASDFDPGAAGIVLPADAERLGLDASGWTRHGAAAALSLKSYRPAAVELTFDAPVQTALLMADTFHPGWVAEIDGEEVPMVRADHAFRMVLLPAGQGTLEMVFRPTTLTLGCVAAMVGFMALCAWALFARRRRAGDAALP